MFDPQKLFLYKIKKKISFIIMCSLKDLYEKFNMVNMSQIILQLPWLSFFRCVWYTKKNRLVLNWSYCG